MNTRRFLAGLTLAASPVLMVGCTGAEVQDFFTQQGRPVSAETAERIAKVVTMLEKKADRFDRCHGDDDSATTTTSPPTTVAANASATRSSYKSSAKTAGWHGDCDHRGHSRSRR